MLLAQSPNDSLARLRVAQEALRSGQPRRALELLEPLVLGQGPSSPFAWDRASPHYWYGRAALASGNAELAKRHLVEATKLHPTLAGNLSLAEALALSGNLEEAHELLESELARSPGSDQVMNGLGTAIISTSKGVMTDKQARREGVGGEVLCTVW